MLSPLPRLDLVRDAIEHHDGIFELRLTDQGSDRAPQITPRVSDEFGLARPGWAHYKLTRLDVDSSANE
jgi:hypothetical protein